VVARRFFQPRDGATSVEVLAELRLDAVAPASGATARYRFEVAVRDSSGTVLATGGWDREVATAVARTAGATATESFRFAVAPGRYTVRVQVAADGGSPVERDLGVIAYASRPPMSDLVLATQVRQAESDSGAVEPGEIRRAGLAMRSGPEPQLLLDSAHVAYYAELYPWQGSAVNGELQVEIVSGGGRRIVQTPPRPMRVEAAGGVARGSLDLTGLPEGRYAFRLLVRLSDSSLAAEAPFAVRGRTATVATTGGAPADPVEALSEASLDSLYGPLEYLLEDSERSLYQTLSSAGRRRFVQEVWRRRDPTPGTPDNAALAEFIRTVAYVNEAFRERGRGSVQGWATDRGRVYLRNGRPDEVLRRPTATPRPYEAWKYTRGRMRYYVFFDHSGFGTYVLIGSNDVREPSQMDWEGYLGREGALDVRQFIR
jgi:GWxTD domain-containing protein